MMAFKIGDIVQLKSSGPRMTVTGLGNEASHESVSCMWFDGKQQHHQGEFPPDALKVASEPTVGAVARRLAR
jgi:uncharacterized protein YodC (DUF2158 family)